MEQALANILDWGVQGAIIIFLGYYIISKEKEHQKIIDMRAQEQIKERETWRLEIIKQWESLERINKETQEVIREHTSVLAEMKGLLKNKNN
jgi:hypothetical protein